MSQFSYELTLQVVNTTIQQLKRSFFLCALSNSLIHQNTVLITKCQFQNNTYRTIRSLFSFDNVNVNFNSSIFYYSKALVKITGGNTVTFFNCNLKHNSREHFLDNSLIQIINSNVTIEDCYFSNNRRATVLATVNTAITITNTKFSEAHNIYLNSIMLLQDSTLLLSGAVVFHNNNNVRSAIKMMDSIITLYGYIEFSENSAFSIITFACNKIPYCSAIRVLDNTTVVISSNQILTYFIDSTDFFSSAFNYSSEDKYIQCLFQYFSSKNLDNCVDSGKFSIIIKHNKFESLSVLHASFQFTKEFGKINMFFPFTEKQAHVLFTTITHCYWLPQSAFRKIIPLVVNRQYIKYTNNSQLLHMSKEKTLCYCSDEKHYDCFKDDEFDSIYPGQTLILPLYANVNYTSDNEVITKIDIKQPYVTQCNVIYAKQNIQLIDETCTMVKYVIGFPANSSWCELFLKTQQAHNQYDAYYIMELPCPLGFGKIDGICQCYPSFKQFGFTDCDIDNQTILRPSKGWIQFNSVQENVSYSCYISQSCPYDYCKPYAFYLNLSIPDSQCQFSRTGLLCGQCQHGLSTMFSSHDCQHCSNIYLLLLIPIIIAGLVLTLILFLLNLTVTDGTINSFIFYMNIVSINYTVFFPNDHTTVPLYTLISLTNLNLGIKTCFYNGMDDYAKIWLQLAFPFYIIFIGIVIILLSRYSITIQRLTVQKSSAVLATLFLLSFTNILCTTSSVLFSYSSLSHLPNEQITLVWSLDANVPLFGFKFTLLFILCLLLFLLLTLFTIIMLCAKALTRFRFLNTILDVYQKPHRLYYWLGLQLVMRIIFLYISILDKNIDIAICMIIINIVSTIQGTQKPFQNKFHNYNEALFMINLLGLYAFVLSEWWIANEVLVVIAGIQFSCVIIYRVANQLCGRVIRSNLRKIF